MNDLKFSATQILEEAFTETHLIRRKAHLQMISAIVTFSSTVKRYEYMLKNPELFGRRPPQDMPARFAKKPTHAPPDIELGPLVDR